MRECQIEEEPGTRVASAINHRIMVFTKLAIQRATSATSCVRASRSFYAAACAPSTSALPAVARRSYATAPPGARNLATVVDNASQAPNAGNVKPYRPEPVVLSPVKEGIVDEAVKALREDIGRPIYLDMQATTPTDPRVLDAMLPYMTNQFGNPHSRTHAYGWETEKAVEEARQVIDSRCTYILGCDADFHNLIS